MADYNDLMNLERKARPTPPPVTTPVVKQETKQQLFAGKPASMQTGKPANQQTSKTANMQAGLHAKLQTGKPAKPEKYSSYLQGDYKKKLKQIALDTDRNEYEVLQEAVEFYLQNYKSKK